MRNLILNTDYRKILFIGATLLVFLPTVALAQRTGETTNTGGRTGETTNTGGRTGETSNTAPIGIKNPLKVDSVAGLVQSFIDIISYLGVLFAVLALVWVGFRFILARGNVEDMKKYRSWLGWIVVGVAVIIGARLIVTIIVNTLEATGTVDPSTIQSVKKTL